MVIRARYRFVSDLLERDVIPPLKLPQNLVQLKESIM